MALDDFIVDSDHPMDLVVFVAEGNITSFSNGYGAATIAHGLPFTPLPFGVWSSNGGTTWQPITGISAEPNKPFAQIYGTSTQVTIAIQLNSSGTPIMYRIFGFAPSGASGDVTPPALRFSSFSLNTDFDYSKLIASIVWPATATSGTTLVTHSLGYIPEVAAWEENSGGQISPMIGQYGVTTAGASALIATASDVQVICPGGAGNRMQKLHVRVYGGKNG